MTLRLGTLLLPSPFLLAPLERVSDVAFRHLCWSLGAAFTFTEMIRARGIARNNKSTLSLIDTFEPEVPTGVQLFAANETELMQALERIEALADTTHPHFRNVKLIDLNFGCPSPEVIRIGAGPALLRRPNKVRSIFETLSAWRRRTTLPIGAITAKIRLGLNGTDLERKVVLPIVELANASLDGLTVHARHAREDSTSKARWSALTEVKARASIPILGNGDVVSRAAAQQLMEQTGCDGVMIARAAIRSPWVFRELNGFGDHEPTLAEIDDAERDWVERARKHSSKPKFFEWHQEGFRRMRERARGQASEGLPENDHMS